MLSSSLTLKSGVHSCVGRNKNGWKPFLWMDENPFLSSLRDNFPSSGPGAGGGGWGTAWPCRTCCVCVLQQVAVLDQRLQLHRVLLLQIIRERRRGQSWDHPEPEEILCESVFWLAALCRVRHHRECPIGFVLPVPAPFSTVLTVVPSNMLNLQKHKSIAGGLWWGRCHAGTREKLRKEGRVPLLPQNVWSQGPYPL